MKVSYRWLKELVDFSWAGEELAEKLTLTGLEVKGAEKKNPPFLRVVVGKVLKITPHPHADLLKLVEVDLGREKIELVCGAPNVKEGQFVPVALAGAILPSGIRVEKRKIRGVDSPGMICSEAELGLGEDKSGIMTLPPLPLGEELSRALDLEDVILDIEITPNRGDCLSHLGIAREIAALLGEKVKLPPLRVEEIGKEASEFINIELEDPELCPYYTSRIIQRVEVSPSPWWMRRRLSLLGFTPINNVVDITNYVLLEMGQPLHAFDYETIEGKRIVVRRGKEREKILTLEGVEREVGPEMLVIADAQKPIALAGIMGGEETGVKDKTSWILLESAYFDPFSIRRTSKTLGLTTEASYRFERRVDPQGVTLALNRAASLIQKITKAQVFKGIPKGGKIPWKKRWVLLRPSRVKRLLGTPVRKGTIEKILQNLSFSLKREKKGLKVEVPSFRADVREETDLVEEIARVYGYGKIRESFPSLVGVEKNLQEDFWKKLKENLKGLGFWEVITPGFISETTLEKCFIGLEGVSKITNPLSLLQSRLRPWLFPSLLEVASYNLKQGENTLRIFELGKVFKKDLKEETNLSGLLIEEEADFFTLKGVVESLLENLEVEVEFLPLKDPSFEKGEAAEIKKEGKTLGRMGKISPPVLEAFELLPSFVFELEIASLFFLTPFFKRFKPLPRYPALERDISLLLKEEIPQERVRKLILREGKWLEKVKLFDFYRGKPIPPGYKSLAYRLTFRNPERTLTDEEVDKIQEKIIKALEKEVEARLRKKPF